MSSKPRFRFTTVVWGTEFTDAFLRVSLPSLLTPRNLPCFTSRTDSCYRIYTVPEDVETITQSAAYRRLAAMMPVEVATVRGISYVGKYRAMTQCHADFIRAFQHEFGAFFFISPDVVWADGTFDRLLDIHAMGKRMVAMTTPRLAKESFIPAYLREYGRGEDVAPITPRQLIKLALSHLHPVTKSQFWEPAPGRRTEPGDIFWKVDEGGFLARAFHLQPLMVQPVDRTLIPTTAVDADYSLKACPNLTEIYVVEDSDDLCYLDFTSSRDRAEFIAVEQTPEQLAKAAQVQSDERHRQFVKHRIRFHCNDLSNRWSAVEENSDHVVKQLLSLIESQPPPSPPWRWRYFSARFWLGKAWRTGVTGLGKQIYSRIVHAGVRRVLGSTVRITVMPSAR